MNLRQIQYILSQHDTLSMDNEADRRRLAIVIWEHLKSERIVMIQRIAAFIRSLGVFKPESPVHEQIARQVEDNDW